MGFVSVVVVFVKISSFVSRFSLVPLSSVVGSGLVNRTTNRKNLSNRWQTFGKSSNFDVIFGGEKPTTLERGTIRFSTWG